MTFVLLSLAGAIAPVAFMLHFVYVRDKYEREPLTLVLRVYFISFLTVLPPIVLEAIGTQALDGAHAAALPATALLAFGVVGVAEEGTKFVFLLWLAFNRKELNEVYDGILYAVAVSLGFATVENVLFVFSVPGFEARAFVVVTRALFSVPLHALVGVVMGYYVGRAKFAPTSAERRQLQLTGLGLAIFWHGLYDFCLLSANLDIPASAQATLALFAPLIVIALWVQGVRYIHVAQALSPFKRPSPFVRPLAAFNPAYRFCTQCGARGLRTDVFCRVCGTRHEVPGARREA